MNDIELKQTPTGLYDWSFNSSDLNNVIGKQQIVSAIKHALNLELEELTLLLYKDKGSNIRELSYLKDNDNTRLLIEENIRLVCVGVAGVSGASVEVLSDDVETVVHLAVRLDNGEEVVINGV